MDHGPPSTGSGYGPASNDVIPKYSNVCKRKGGLVKGQVGFGCQLWGALVDAVGEEVGTGEKVINGRCRG